LKRREKKRGWKELLKVHLEREAESNPNPEPAGETIPRVKMSRANSLVMPDDP